MPIPLEINRTPQELVWLYKHIPNTKYNSTGSCNQNVVLSESKFIFNSHIHDNNLGHFDDSIVLDQNLSNKRYIKYFKSLQSQFLNLSPFYEGITYEHIESFTSQIVSALLDLNPDAFGFELTSEKSIFYTFKKNNLSFYIQHFLENDEDDDYNASLVIFEGDEKQSSLSGDIVVILNEISHKFSASNSIATNSFCTYELSY